ncbi:hypothetical protein [Roseivirga pacifica]|uniref:hypothetical protein n=1 Tax=Roseivirga pacifica TaxID=1267423 RepID=UPI003BAE599A
MNNESYIRWQNIRITQLGFANNLILGISIALIGFMLDFLQTDDLVLNSCQKFLFWVGGSLTLVSIGFGLYVVFNKLDDFRLTAQIARKRETGKTDGIEDDRTESKVLGTKTWNCFIWQVSTLIVGFLLNLVLVLIEIKDIIT